MAKETMGLWCKNGIPGGKYLVQRRDGTIPEWPLFVLGARDPAAAAALSAYASVCEEQGRDATYVANVRELVVEFDAYRAEHGEGDPDAPPHRTDDPAIVGKMCGSIRPDLASAERALAAAEAAVAAEAPSGYFPAPWEFSETDADVRTVPVGTLCAVKRDDGFCVVRETTHAVETIDAIRVSGFEDPVPICRVRPVLEKRSGTPEVDAAKAGPGEQGGVA